MSVPADPSRVYVGNVNFNATEAELKELFEDFNVVSVEIPFKTITRGEKTFQRRLGFGFVQFENETDANNAISQFNGKKFKQRQIYAKKALPPATEEEKQKKRELFIAKQAQLKEKKRDSKQAELPTQATEKDGTIELSTEKTTSTGHVNKTPEGKKSTDTIFVTNLDFKANVKSLNELFKDLNPIWVNVPTKRVPFHVLKKFSATRKAIYNKGIAFVKFADEATQLQAIKEFNGKEINGRKIVVEVAVDKPVSSETSSSDSTASPDAVISGELNETENATPGSGTH